MNNIFSSSRIVVNLSSMNFDPHVFCILEKELNFSLAPRKILMEDIICNIEFGIRDLFDNIKEAIR